MHPPCYFVIQNVMNKAWGIHGLKSRLFRSGISNTLLNNLITILITNELIDNKLIGI